MNFLDRIRISDGTSYINLTPFTVQNFTSVDSITINNIWGNATNEVTISGEKIFNYDQSKELLTINAFLYDSFSISCPNLYVGDFYILNKIDKINFYNVDSETLSTFIDFTASSIEFAGLAGNKDQITLNQLSCEFISSVIYKVGGGIPYLRMKNCTFSNIVV